MDTISTPMTPAQLGIRQGRNLPDVGIEHSPVLLCREVDRTTVRCRRRAAHQTLQVWQLRRVREYIDSHIDSRIRVSDLGELVNRSEGHFSRTFKRSLGHSPHAYVNRCRVEHACNLMLNSEAALSEIAQSCGFVDQSHLCNLFRQMTGLSPAAWRRERCNGIGSRC